MAHLVEQHHVPADISDCKVRPLPVYCAVDIRGRAKRTRIVTTTTAVRAMTIIANLRILVAADSHRRGQQRRHAGSPRTRSIKQIPPRPRQNRFHLDAIDAGEIAINWTPTQDQIKNTLTAEEDRVRFTRNRGELLG